MSVRPGTRLDGRYRLADRLAYGGMGEVWRAMDEVLSREVAVKILRPELAEDEAFVRRFRAEARTTSGLPHNGIAAVYDYGETRVGADGQSPALYDDLDADPVAYLVMELVPGEALSSILSRDGALTSERTLDLVAQAARALHAAHVRGVIHRDIKPANLMVTPDGRVKVTDFGIARPLDHEPLTATGQVMGTAHYLAPELAKGQDASPLSDVYALGVVAYECLAGHRPFEGDNQVAVALAHLNELAPPLPATIPAPVRAVVGSAMEKEPSRRMPSAEAFAAALETLRYRPLDEHLTPGTGILPNGPAAAGLQAAGLLEPGQQGWPGGQQGWAGAQRDGSLGAASSPVAARVQAPEGRLLGTHAPGPNGTAPHPNGTATGALGYADQRDPYANQRDPYADQRDPYANQYAYPGDQYGGGHRYPGSGNGYPGPADPFRTPTAPGGVSLPARSLRDRDRPRRSVGGPLLLIAGVLTLAVIALLVAWMNGVFNAAPSDVNVPGTSSTASAPATTAPSPSTAPASHSPTPSRTHHVVATHSPSKSPSPSATPTPSVTPTPTTTPTGQPTTTPTQTPPRSSPPPTSPSSTAGGTATAASKSGAPGGATGGAGAKAGATSPSATAVKPTATKAAVGVL